MDFHSDHCREFGKQGVMERFRWDYLQYLQDTRRIRTKRSEYQNG